MAPKPIRWASKIILAKNETTYATDPAPTGALNAMVLTDVQLQPMEGEDVARNLELPYRGAQEEVPVGLRAVLTGSFELVGSGTAGTPPAWAPLMRALGAAEVITAGTSVEYSPISDDYESVCLHFQIGRTRHVLLGSRGTGVLTVNAQGIPVCRATITGLFTMPSEVDRPTVDLTKWQKPQVASKANTPVFTIGGTGFKLRNFSLDLANTVEPRLLIGYEGIEITGSNEQLSATVEAVPLDTYNPYAKAIELARQEVIVQHGTVAGRRVEVSAPTATQHRLTGFEQAQGITEWPLTFRPLPSGAGNNQWKIKLT